MSRSGGGGSGADDLVSVVRGYQFAVSLEVGKNGHRLDRIIDEGEGAEGGYRREVDRLPPYAS